MEKLKSFGLYKMISSLEKKQTFARKKVRCIWKNYGHEDNEDRSTLSYCLW